jgi:hypothetical protein
MPMKYNEDTGVPYFVPDTAIELEEGVTPAPDVLRYGKRGIFAGDPPPKIAASEIIRDKPAPPGDSEFFVKLGKSLGVEKPIDSTTHIKGEQTTVPVGGVEQGKPDLGKLYDDAMYSDGIAKMATPAKLSAMIATDAEIAEIERLCNERSVMYWPTLMRLINRVRMTEELLRVERSRR